MPQPNDLSRSPIALNQDGTLIAIIEMSRSSWLVAGIVPGIARHPLKKLAPDEAALRGLLERWRGEAVQAWGQITRIAVAYEAGRDGFWLARWLRAHGIEAYVIHPTSVAVSREHRRAKTDRLDTALLKRVFLGWLRGEPGHCTMAAIPTLEEEDARRPGAPRHFAHPGRGTTPAQHPGRAAPRHGAPGVHRGADQGNRGRPAGGLGDAARPRAACDGASAGPGDRDWHRDRRQARARDPLPQPARPAGGGALCGPHRLPRRERCQTAGERSGQGGQCPGAARHGAAGLALRDHRRGAGGGRPAPCLVSDWPQRSRP